MVLCDSCTDFFAVGGIEVAEGIREGREAVMPDGRSVRSIELIAMDHA